MVHASPDAPAVDVAVKGGPVLFAGLPFPRASAYASVPAGTYDPRSGRRAPPPWPWTSLGLS